ncbi:MAG TPA: A/G-specific adenine glycosylase [Candidatus Xenobia bacterium]|nr:A/G-specific adenine glycosylase [Candidatus Xenobia bacterium]
MRRVRQALLLWFDTNKRDLPWRRTRDPYRIWVAEIMLQQTRVPTVISYYHRFLRVFPTVHKLARARLGSVLRLWAGLGYYSRARNLHEAAKRIVREHNGCFPDSLDAALALPGIGAYTARAILSIAYQNPVAVVDGNVARVLVRLFRLCDADPNNRSALQPLADKLVDPRRPGDFNQALMELGSTICLPRVPRCAECPLERLCAARQAGMERQFGLRRNNRVRPTTTLNVLIARRNGRVLLVREPDGVFSGLWHFPYAASRSPAALARRLGAKQLRFVDRVAHEMTARNLALRVYEGRIERKGTTPGRWVEPKDIAKLGVGAATRKILTALESRG